MSDALLPCPFCGGEPRIHYDNGNKMLAFVLCVQCRSVGHKERQDDDGARLWWNRRAPAVPPDALVLSAEEREALVVVMDAASWWQSDGDPNEMRDVDIGAAIITIRAMLARTESGA